MKITKTTQQKPKIVISAKLKTFLDSHGKKNDTYENIIWRLINAQRA